MAEISGASAYSQLQPVKSNASQTAQFWGAQQNKQFAEQREVEREADKEDAKQLRDWEEKTGLKVGDFQNKYTGFKNFDDVNTDFAQYATSEYVKVQREAAKAREAGNTDELRNLEGKLIRMKNSFGEVAKSQKFFGDLFKTYQEAVRNNQVSGASQDWEDIVQAALMENNMAIRYMDGNLVYTGLVNGKPKTVPYQDLMDGSFSWIKRQNINNGKGSVVDSISDNLGKTTTITPQGYFTKTEQVWNDDIQGKATSTAIDALTSADTVMADLLNQVSGGKSTKRGNFTQEDYDLVKSKITEQVKGAYTTKVEEKFNTSQYATDVSAATARMKESNRAAEAAQKAQRDANKPKTKAQEKQAAMSKLRYDAQQALKGDYTVLMGSNIDPITGRNVNVKSVTESPDGKKLIITDDRGKKTEVYKSERAVLEYKLRGKPEYKGVTVTDVMGAEPDSYRKGGGDPLNLGI